MTRAGMPPSRERRAPRRARRQQQLGQPDGIAEQLARRRPPSSGRGQSNHATTPAGVNAWRSWPTMPGERADPPGLLALGLRALADRDPALEAPQVDAEQRGEVALRDLDRAASQRASSFGVRASPTSSASPSAASACESRSSAIRRPSRSRSSAAARASSTARCTSSARYGSAAVQRSSGVARTASASAATRAAISGATPSSIASRSLSASTAAAATRGCARSRRSSSS